MCRSFLVFLCLCFSSTCLAWGGRGHAAIAALAQENLTPAALSQVNELLREDLDRYEQPSGRTTLAAVASWPDEIRDLAVKTDPAAYKGWHVRGNQVCSTTLGACKNRHCVDELIMHYAKILQDKSQPTRARNEALKWVVHLVGDLHMPLHSGINLNGGGAKVSMEGVELKPGATLHTIWDSELANSALKDWKSSARLENAPALAEDAPTRWMLETRELALHEVYEPLAGFSCNAKLAEPIRIDVAYQQHSVTVVRHQVERAGLRLAQLLNELLQ